MLKVADSINHAHKQTTGVCVVLENVAGGVSHYFPCKLLQGTGLVAVHKYLSATHSLTPAGLQAAVLRSLVQATCEAVR